MAADVVLLAKALVVAINEQSWAAHQFQARGGYIPRPKLVNLGDIAVTVVPAGLDVARETRARLQLGNMLEVGIHKKLKMSEDAEADVQREPDIDEMIDLVQRMVVFLSGEVLTAESQQAKPLGAATTEPLWDPETLDEQGVFVAVIRAGYRTWQDRPMATTIEANYVSDITVVKTFDGVFLDDDVITVNGLNRDETINASSSVPATKEVSAELAMSGGAATIDLTALVGDNGEAVTFSGLKVQIAKFKNKSTNANVITVAKGASNGYTGLGASFSIALQPGAEATFYLNEAAADVSGSVKTIDISGTAAQVIQYQLVAG